MAAPNSSAPARSARLCRAVAVVATLFLAYTAFGFLAAPRIVRGLIVKNASEALHRPVSVANVRINPLVLSATVEGFAVTHRSGEPFVAWDSLYVRAAPLRFFRGELGLAEVRLVRPSLSVGLRPDGSLTFQDLLAADGAAPKAGASSEPTAVSIGELAVESARVVFSDATRRPAFHTAIGPVTFRLDSFRTTGGGDSPYAFSGTTDAGETFRWRGTIGTQPFRSAGTLAFEHVDLPRYEAYVRDAAPIVLTRGLLDLETRYELEWGAAKKAATLSEGRLAVTRLAVGPPGAAMPPVDLPVVRVSGIAVDAISRAATIGEVSVEGGRVRVLRERDGKLELARMAPPPSPAPPPPAWKWSIGAVAVSGLAVDVEDRTTPRPVTLPLTDVKLRVEDLRDAKDCTCRVAAALVWNGHGRLDVSGPVQPYRAKGVVQVDLAELDLAPLQPYLEPGVVARVAAGTAGARVKLGFDASGDVPRWTVAGDARIDGLAVTEKGNEELLRWQALEVSGIDAESAARRASVRSVRLLNPRAKAYLWEDGTSSLARAVQRGTPPAVKAAAQPRAAAAPEWQTNIGSVQIVSGRATLVDRSIMPAAVVNVTRADAKVTNLSSDPRVRSKVDARVEVEGASPLAVSGTLNALQKSSYTDLAVTSRGVDLSPLDPYSGKYLGYRIQKGKLDLDLRYSVDNRRLAATNVVKVNQFTLGQGTNSPDATKIPVRLALALLQDRDGVILLDVPVEGNLDDPEFHLGKVIWRTVLNVLTKVALSPFSALASLAGGGDADLSVLEFTPGTAAPVAGAQDALAKLASSLAQRPALVLDIEGSSDADRDGPILRRAALLRSLRPGLDAANLAADDRVRLVRTAYDAAFSPVAAKKGEQPPRPLTPEEMEDRLAATVEVPPDAYRALAAERAQRARDALVAAGVAQERLFLAQGGRAEKEKGARVYFTVR